MSPRTAGAVGALLVALAVAVGAFGAHTLEARLPESRLATLDTATSYQFYGGLGLLGMAVVGFAAPTGVARAARTAGALLAAGVALFCGALYALVAGGPSFLGLVAPFGGGAMILAWMWLAYAFWSRSITTAPPRGTPGAPPPP